MRLTAKQKTELAAEANNLKAEIEYLERNGLTEADKIVWDLKVMYHALVKEAA